MKSGMVSQAIPSRINARYKLYACVNRRQMGRMMKDKSFERRSNSAFGIDSFGKAALASVRS